MLCQWCADREAKWWGKPWWGPLSRMCDACLQRVCRKDKYGFVCEPYDSQEKKGAAA